MIMAKNNNIAVILFGEEIGRLGFDPDQNTSFFQYSPSYLDSGMYSRIFPYVFKRIKPVQVFKQYHGATFRSLPPMIADSLPDVFGNTIFKEWLAFQDKNFKSITPLEQLAYVANRGMGALEYLPAKDIPTGSTIQINEIVAVLDKVLNNKQDTAGDSLNTAALLNIFKIGTSAGGARPKILVSEEKKSGKIIPGDLAVSDAYNHYLVKLYMPEEFGYNREKVEYAYYQLATKAGLNMMPSKLIDDQHFATLRYDRQDGQKQHSLTATGLTGWDYKSLDQSSYENLFKLALDLKVPYKDLQELFRRMAFNIVFANSDDHLKNHSFIYDKEKDAWSIAPAYDLTYPFSIDLNFTQVSRALSINNKRRNIDIEDLIKVADEFSIKNPKGIITEVMATLPDWEAIAASLSLPEKVISSIKKSFVEFDL